MLSRTKRLTRATFGTVATGKRAVSAHFSVSYTHATPGRVAAVISKKTAKKAVDRHLLKRRILAAAEPHIEPVRSFIVYARKGSPELSYQSLKKELDALLTTLPKV